MRKLLIIPAVALGLVAAGCGQTAAQACVEGYGPGATPFGGNDEEKFCVVDGKPVGEVENEGVGWKADD